MISQKLKELKEARGMSNVELSRLSGIPLPVISRIIAGQTSALPFDTVRRLVLALGGDPNDFDERQ